MLKNEVTDGIQSLRQQATDSNLVDHYVPLESYVNCDDHVLTTKEFVDNAVVNEDRELHDENVNDASSDKDDDTWSPVPCTTALHACDVPKDFVVDRGRPVDYVAHLNAPGCKVVICKNNQKQAKMMSCFQQMLVSNLSSDFQQSALPWRLNNAACG